jgi:hypothetical protein
MAPSIGTAQRVRRGFHRLAIFPSAIPLLIGIAVSIIIARDHTNALRQYHGELGWVTVRLYCINDGPNGEHRKMVRVLIISSTFMTPAVAHDFGVQGHKGQR